MYYQSYEEYMRDVLGYPRETSMPTYNNFYMADQRNYEYHDEEVQKLYPEVYRQVYPMVCKACNQYRGEITEDLVCKLTEEVYTNFEVEYDVRGEEKTIESSQIKVGMRGAGEKVEKEETRQRRPNNLLRDLIKILIIRELLNRRRRPGRPPFPGGRPPFPGGPRPPMPRNVQNPLYFSNQFEPRYYGNEY